MASAEVLANSIAATLVFSDPKSARQELQTFSRGTDVMAVQVLQPDRTLFVQWQQQELSQILPAPANWPQRAHLVSGWQQYQIQLPVLFKQE